MPSLINWNIAKSPFNWVKITLMAFLGFIAFHLVMTAVIGPNSEDA